MEIKALPRHPNLEQYKKRAKDLVKLRASGDSATTRRIEQVHPAFHGRSDAEADGLRFTLTDAQLVLAREHGFSSWPKFSARIAAIRLEHSTLLATDPAAAFLDAACVPLNGDSHGSGTLEAAEEILRRHPEVATHSLYTAAVLGDWESLQRVVAADPQAATAKGGLHGWDALTYLCFSRYLRLDRARSEGFVRAATVLLDAGASANTGWFEVEHQSEPVWESVLYGAAGSAQHPELTRLLLERGGDPNDDETPYHAPETYDNATLTVLVESGKLNPDSLTTMLLRKTDWHDVRGIVYLLEHGADPNRMTRWHHTALHWAIRRDNDIEVIEAMLDHGADPSLRNGLNGKSAMAMAARRGRGDVLEAIGRRNLLSELTGVDRLIAACARGDGLSAGEIAGREPELLHELLAEGGARLAEFAGRGNTDGVRVLLDLGLEVDALSVEGDAYFNSARNSTALHAAAWRIRPETVRLLLDRGASVNAQDGKGRTPLTLAVRACVDSHWVARRSPEPVRMLLLAGATVSVGDYPSGYVEVDELLEPYRRIVQA